MDLAEKIRKGEEINEEDLSICGLVEAYHTLDAKYILNESAISGPGGGLEGISRHMETMEALLGKKTTTKTVEKIGTYEEIKKICGDMEPLEWAKAYAAKRTAEEKVHKQDIVMRYSSSSLIDKNVRRSCNAGYLFLQDIYYSLGLDKICDSISDQTHSPCIARKPTLRETTMQ